MAELRGAQRRRMIGRRQWSLAAGLIAGLLPAAGAHAQQADPNPGYATQPFTPQNFAMPGGEGCSGEVARWQAVQTNDYASGNIGLKVYHQVQGEIARADAACRAGHDAEARNLVHASKRRHGYPD